MKKALILLALFASPAYAQVCVNNADAVGNVCTTFTLGEPTSNCIPVTSQDGVATTNGAVCPLGFFGGGGLQIWLPNDPSNSGNSLTMYSCVQNLISDVATGPPAFGATRTVTDALSCPGVNYGYYTADWNGTLIYNYVSVYQRRCSSGRGAHCISGYFFVNTNGVGEIATPPPPPAPPPPPQPVEYDLTFGPNSCDATLTCVLIPTDQTVVQIAVLFMSSQQLLIGNADGTVDSVTLDYLQVTAIGDEGPQPGSDDPQNALVTGSGEVYDANGLQTKQVSFTLNVTTLSNGSVSVTSGSMVIVIPVQ